MITGQTDVSEEKDYLALLEGYTPSSIIKLQGNTPAEKHRNLNYTVQNIGKTEESSRNHANYTPLVRTVAAVHLRLPELVLEALTSTDAEIAKCAMKADWFFSAEHVEFKNYCELFAKVSLRTRSAIIKKLSTSLIGHEDMAKEFFEGLINMYGLQTAMPFLKACSADYIYEQVLKLKITLSVKTVDELFKRCPELVLKYLELGNKNNSDNYEDRLQHEIRIHEYDSFLPKLIKNYPKIFLELYSVTPGKELVFSEKSSEVFMKSMKKEVIARPEIFLKLLSLDVVCEHLDKDQMVTVVENFFPKDVQEFNLDQILDIIDHYHHGNKIEFLKDRYSFFYDKDLLEDENHVRSMRLQKMLSPSDRKSRARFFARKYEFVDPEKFLVFVGFLPPEEAIPILMAKVPAALNAEDRSTIFGHALTSCGLYNSKPDLLEVLRLFLKSFKDEPKKLLVHRFYWHLSQGFNLQELPDTHWLILQEIILLAYVKKQLFITHLTSIENFLEAALRYMLVKQPNSENLEKIFEITVECKVTNYSPKFNMMKDDQKLERLCLEKFLQIVPMKFPENHDIWKDYNSKLSLTFYIVDSIHSYNWRHAGEKKSKNTKRQSSRINIEDYPWIISLVDQFYDCEKGYRRDKTVEYLKKLAPEIYESKLDELAPIRDIDTGEALELLKTNYKKIANHWYEYLTQARQKLLLGNKAAQRFVYAVKWYNEISAKFIERCANELDDFGSIIVLGILLEKDSFEAIVSPLVSNEMTFDPDKNSISTYDRARAIILAMRHVNPPVSFDLITAFCHNDYAHLCDGTLMSLVHKMPADKIIKFARVLASNRSSDIRKIALRMVQALATRSQLREFLEETWRTEKNTSVRLVIAKVIFENFCKVPTTKNWDLMKTCMEGLTVNDRRAFEKFTDVELVDPNYVSLYIEEYLQKIEALTNMDSAMRTKCVCIVIEGITSHPKIMSSLSEETCLMILKKYFVDADSMEISTVVQNFALRSYLLPAEEKLEPRLESVMQILTGIMEHFDRPHPKKPRHYAANYTIHGFFCHVLTEISVSESVNKMDILEGFLKVFKSTLSPWQESWTYLALNLYKEYLQSETPRQFGTRCANRLPELIEEFHANDLVINDVALCLEDFIAHKIFQDAKKINLKLSIIEGLLEGSEHYGSLLATKLLNHFEIEMYDERYDKIVKQLQNKRSEIILYCIYNHVNYIRPYCVDN